MELRAAVRSLRRAPWFTTAIVAVLALGIGGSTAVFSVTNSVLLKPLPYESAGQLVRLYQADREGGARGFVSGPAFEGYRSELASISKAAGLYTYRETGADLATQDGAVRVRSLSVTSEYFEVLREEPAQGRAFTREEERDGARVAVVSSGLWRSHLGGRSDVVGSKLELSGEPYTIVGLVDGLEDPVVGAVDVWLPQPRPVGDPQGANHPQNYHLTVLARLVPGVGLEQARSELALLDRRHAAQYPGAAGKVTHLVGLHEDTVGGSARMLYVLLGAVGLVLLIGCVNVANLLLARATTREREFAVRAALGSGRNRLMTQLVLESVLLAAAGCAAGLVLGSFLLDAIIRLGRYSVPRLDEAGFDLRVLLFAAGVSAVCALVFGLLPAWRQSRAAESGVLRDTARSVTADRRRSRMRMVLVGTQMALAFMLLTGAGIMALSMHRLMALDLGFDPENLLTFEVHLPEQRYDAARRAAFHEELPARLSALPNIEAAGGVSRLPTTGQYHGWAARPLTGPRAGMDETLPAEQRVISGRYFDALRLRPVTGRLFDARDDGAAPRRIVISESLAAAAFPSADPLGQRLRILSYEATVIGVVPDVALTVEGDVRGTVYHAHTQFADNRNWPLVQVVRLAEGGSGVPRAVAAVLADLDPQLGLHRPLLFVDVIGRSVAERRFALWLMIGYAALATVLAAVGLFGVITYVVRQRRREIAIRAALGARPAQIRGMVLNQGLGIAFVGIACGVLGALALSRIIAALLFATSPADPVALLAAATALLLTSTLAAYLPAREATRVDPNVVLQQD